MVKRITNNEEQTQQLPELSSTIWPSITAILTAVVFGVLFTSFSWTSASPQCPPSKRPGMFQGADDQSEAFTTGMTVETPPSPPPGYAMDDFPEQVPWHGNTYIIVEKGTRRAITLTGGGLGVADIDEKGNKYQHWLGVEKKGYFGFLNATAGTYIGHDNHASMRASATELREWEYLTPRRHPLGGYQLLSPHWVTLRVVSVADGGKRLKWAEHGSTLWEFEKV